MIRLALSCRFGTRFSRVSFPVTGNSITVGSGSSAVGKLRLFFLLFIYLKQFYGILESVMADKEPRRRRKKKDAIRKDETQIVDPQSSEAHSPTCSKDSDVDGDDEAIPSHPEYEPSKIAQAIFIVLFVILSVTMGSVFIALRGSSGPFLSHEILDHLRDEQADGKVNVEILSSQDGIFEIQEQDNEIFVDIEDKMLKSDLYELIPKADELDEGTSPYVDQAMPEVASIELSDSSNNGVHLEQFVEGASYLEATDKDLEEPDVVSTVEKERLMPVSDIRVINAETFVSSHESFLEVSDVPSSEAQHEEAFNTLPAEANDGITTEVHNDFIVDLHDHELMEEARDGEFTPVIPDEDITTKVSVDDGATVDESIEPTSDALLMADNTIQINTDKDTKNTLLPNSLSESGKSYESMSELPELPYLTITDDESGVDIGIRDMESGVSNNVDYKVEQQLDDIDKLLGKTPANAILKYEELLKVYPSSPRALFGKARALDLLADLQHSNKLLEDAISAYQEVLSAKGVPDELYIVAGKRCVERMQFRGFLGKSIKVLTEMAKKFPSNVDVKNKIGVGYLLIGQNVKAKEVFSEILKEEPNNGFAKVHLGFILKTMESKYEESIRLLMEGIESRENGVIDGRFFFHLGDALTRIGRNVEATKIYEKGVKENLFLSTYQRSLYNVVGLSGKPWWNPETTKYTESFKILEKNWVTIKAEAMSLLGSTKFSPESEGLKNQGEWQQFELFVRGRKIVKNCESAQFTCSLIEPMLDASTCKRGQVMA